ncbi:hypothetical protein C9I43_00865 [Shewanella morhuae]|uniref:Cysteine-rich CWC n=1 Tax=Shewanella morhuae TaxID=365591 RepID=A0ABX5HSN1_9GAMM|nr:cysteine-rich CWC family protein [Shewanella morhuae]PTA49174.1 hypothetical protein C9I43_00865 [Shewanella morhuae]
MSQSLEQPKLEAAQICPLCQGANQCAVILGKGIEDCWCALQVFPPLAALQEQALDEPQVLSLQLASTDACICQVCLSLLKQGGNSRLFRTQDEQSPSRVVDGLGYELT